MKQLFWILPLLLFVQCSSSRKVEEQINLISFNIRFDNPDDGINAWSHRKDDVAALIKFHTAHIVCLQEALYNQIIDLETRLPNFKWVGVGRDDGNREGEYTAIFYDENMFTLVDEGTFWLSETPEKPSFGWDAACVRISTFAKLRAIRSGAEFYVFNTHFDHVGSVAQLESAKLIVQKINDIASGSSVVLAGDFNLLPNSEAIQPIMDFLHDSYTNSEKPPYGPVGTWNAFDYLSPLDRRIDYVFVNDNFRVNKYANLTDSKEQRFPSDHLPVFVKIVLKTP